MNVPTTSSVPVTPGSECRDVRWLLLLIGLGILVHLTVTLPALAVGETAARFSRPDSPGYLGPALSLAQEGRYLDGPGGEPYLYRSPGLSVVLTPFFLFFGENGALPVAALFLGVVGVLTTIPVYLTGREWFGERCGLAAAALFLFNPTGIANRPLFLTDTLFTFLVAWQLYFFIRFWKDRNGADFLISCAVAAVGMLVRPINLTWIFPALFILAVMPKLPWRRKLILGGVALALFFAIPAPWMYRNAQLGAGWVLDINTGSMYHQNGAMLRARVNGTGFEEEKRKILAELETEFADTARYPDAKSKVDYRLRKFRELILAHPFLWLSQHFRPQVLLPDFPTLCENWGLTRSDRGTLGVLQRDGLWAAVRHYFNGQLWLPFVLAPLLIPVLITYAGALWMLIRQLRDWRREFIALLIFLAFAEYYFFLPGPITVPRYQLPALPVLTVLAGAVLCLFFEKMRKKSAERSISPQDLRS